MPSKDSTGKRIGGTAQRRRAAEHAAARAQLAAVAPALAARLPGARPRVDEDDSCPLHAPPPPYGEGVAAGVTWAARLQAQAAQLAQQGADAPRVRAVNACTKAISAAKAAAADSERAVRLAAAYLGRDIDATGEALPEEPAGIVLWAFWRLCALCSAVATQPGAVDDAQAAHTAKALALCAAVQPQAAIDALTAQAETAAELATVPLRAAS